jgi:hypothetical protein
MSLEKLAKILYVDEVSLMHGPKGVAVHVRIEKSWHSTTIDNEDLHENRLETIAKHLAFLADAHVHKIRRGEDLRKADMATRAALQADEAARQRGGMLSWKDVGGYQLIQRTETSPRVQQPPPATSPEPAVSNSMPSRFHAIMEELKGL